MLRSARIYLIVFVGLSSGLLACSRSQLPEPNYPGYQGLSHWNENISLKFWQAAPDLPLRIKQNGKFMPEAVIKADLNSVTFQLSPDAYPLAKRVIVEVFAADKPLLLNVEGRASYGLVFTPLGIANSGRVNVLLDCSFQSLSSLEKLFGESPEFRLLDYFGDRQSLRHSALGQSSHPDPWCLAVLGFENLATETALGLLKLFLGYYQIPYLALSPDFYIYGNDPGVKSFDTDCGHNQLLMQEATTAQVIKQADLRRLVGLSQSRFTGRGVTVVLLDGGVSDAKAFRERSSYARFSRRFLEADYPQANPRADDIEDDFDCNETAFLDKHGALVSRIVEVIAPEASIIALKVCDEHGLCATSSLVKALLYVRNRYQGFPTVDIINMSFGGRIAQNTVFETMLRELMQAQPHTLFVASVGNEPQAESHYPAQYQVSYPSLIAVAAAKMPKAGGQGDWQLAQFNTHKVLSLSPWGKPLAAPGVALLLEGLGNPQGITGTSFAAPVLTAVAALERQRNPGLSAEGLHQRLYAYATDAVDFRLLKFSP